MDLKVLIIDDDITQLKLVSTIISKIEFPKCSIDIEEEPGKAIDLFYKNRYDLVITDHNMEGLTGIDVINTVNKYNPNIPVVVITSLTDIREVIDIMKLGVYDFITKPIEEDIIKVLIKRVYELTILENEVCYLRNQINKNFSVDSIIGNSTEIKTVIEIIGKCSEHSVNTLIRGESGTGKELVAHALHFTSLRKEKPFVIVNIAALSESLIDSELFGHAKGSFTGADKDRIGRFEEANEGTLFIDEIGDIPLSIQVKLLRAIQFKEFQRVGENTTRKSDVRILAATSRNLEELMENGDFRRDLYYRLNVVEINIPPLRERKVDIPLLIDFFVNKDREENDIQFSKEAMHQLITYDYPGNVRELANIVEHAIVFSRGSFITLNDLPVILQGSDDKYRINDNLTTYKDIMSDFETKFLIETLANSNWNKSKAARSIGISERRLRYRMEILSIEPPKEQLK